MITEQDDISLKLETTWLEESGSRFNRVIVIEYWTSDLVKSTGDALIKTHGEPLRDRIKHKIKEDLDLDHETDYIFGVYDNPVMRDGVWTTPPLMNQNRIIIRLSKDEHFTMFKLHYQ